MILFLEDWAKYPTAIVHSQTRNKSFLRMAEVYKKMGVKNYYFHLALMQPELADVDPHSKHLTDEEKIMIGVECRFNPWYYFREVALVPPQAGSEPFQIRANRGNLALWWLFFNHVDLALIQPRQTGKSLCVDELMDYLLDVSTTNTDITMLTKDDSLRVDNVERLKEIRELLPTWLTQKSKTDSDNKHELTCKALNNKYKTSVAQGSIAGANKIGRGATSPIMHVDEGPFCNNINITIPAMLSAGTAAIEEAKQAGAHYGTIFTTTAGKKDTREGKYMHDMIFGGMVWTEKLYDCNDVTELKFVIEKNSTGKKTIVNCTFSHRQLGYTDQWLHDTIRRVNATPQEAERDFLNMWTSGTTTSPLTAELNEIIRNSEEEPSYTEITKDGYIVRWYIPEEAIAGYMAGNKTVIGMDTSEAIGRDAVTMVLINVKNLKVVASAHFNETNLVRLAGFIATFMIKYTNTILIPERRSSGQTFIDTLLIRLPAVGIDPFRRIYNVLVNDYIEREEEYKRLQQTDPARRSPDWYDKNKSMFGFATAGSGKHSRNGLYSDVLQQMARKGGNSVKDIPLINEITSLVVKNGKIDHSSEGHDDMVIAWLLAGWLLLMGKNLSYYGIDNPLSDVIDVIKASKNQDEIEEDLYNKQRTNEIKEQIESLLGELKREDDDFVQMKLESRIRHLDGQLGGEFNSTESIDSLLKEAKEIRQKKARERRRHHSNVSRTVPFRYYQ